VSVAKPPASAAALAAFVGLLAGCGGSPSPPDFGDPSLAGRRTAAVEKAKSALGEVIGVAHGRILGRGSYDGCYKGQQNYKVDEGYAYRCTVRAVGAVGMTGDFRRRIALLDAQLFRSGWALDCATCEKDTLTWLVEEYWDFRVAQATPQAPFSISWLPTPGQPYEKGDLLLTFQYAGRDRSGRQSLEGAHRMRRGGVFRSDERVREVDTRGVLARAQDDEHLLVIAVEIDYFES
jgi:hypothetical protein